MLLGCPAAHWFFGFILRCDCGDHGDPGFSLCLRLLSTPRWDFCVSDHVWFGRHSVLILVRRNSKMLAFDSSRASPIHSQFGTTFFRSRLFV